MIGIEQLQQTFAQVATEITSLLGYTYLQTVDENIMQVINVHMTCSA
jgi:hypothetical protein